MTPFSSIAHYRVTSKLGEGGMGELYLYSGRVYEKDGREAHWRGIYDDHGRVMVTICFNMDLGDSWEWADVPAYPAKFSDLGLRIAVNYALYAMTH